MLIWIEMVVNYCDQTDNSSVSEERLLLPLLLCWPLKRLRKKLRKYCMMSSGSDRVEGMIKENRLLLQRREELRLYWQIEREREKEKKKQTHRKMDEEVHYTSRVRVRFHQVPNC